MISYKGNLSILLVFPVMAQMVGIIDIPGLTAQVAAMTQLVANFKPPTVAASLSFLATLTANIQATVSYPVVQISAELLAKLALFKARLELILQITDIVFGGSVRLYEYDGAAGNFGPDLTSALAGPEADGGVAADRSTFALVLLAEGGTSGETTLRALRSGV